jgi:hypothetical protein
MSLVRLLSSARRVATATPLRPLAPLARATAIGTLSLLCHHFVIVHQKNALSATVL